MAVAVVILHHSVTLIMDAEEPLYSLCILFQEGICRLAVPCFFLISGYLFFNHMRKWDWGMWTVKLRRRAHSLLLPYLIWNVIAFFVYWGYSHLFGEPVTLLEHFHNCGGIKMFWSVNGGLPLGVHAAPVDAPLWFIRDLMVYMLLTPFIYLFVKWTRLWGYLALALLHLLVQGIVPEGFLFFVTGAYLMIEDKEILDVVWPVRKLLYVVFTLTLMLGFLFHDQSEYWTRFFKVFMLFSGIGTAFSLASVIVDSFRDPVSPFLVRSSFFIFALHEVLLPRHYSGTIMQHIYFSSGTAWDCIEFFLTPAIVVGLCLGILFLLEKIMPGVAAILTGKRNVQPSKQ